MEKVSENVVEIPVEKIVVPDWRIRKEVLKDKSFEELKESIKVNGQLQPVEVQLLDGGKYEIVFGLCRYAAVQELGWNARVQKIFQTGIISERPLAEGATAVSGVKGVAESLKVNVGTAARSLKAEAAVKKHPALDRLETASLKAEYTRRSRSS